jgi:hypothetical protein
LPQAAWCPAIRDAAVPERAGSSGYTEAQTASSLPKTLVFKFSDMAHGKAPQSLQAFSLDEYAATLMMEKQNGCQ